MLGSIRRTGGALLILLSVCGCPSSAPTPPPVPPVVNVPAPVQFADRAADWGVNFRYQNGEQAGLYSILETLGGGVGLLDYDRDGYPDVWCVGGGSFPRAVIPPVGLPSGLFRNRGTGFSAVAGPSGITVANHFQHGIAAADVDHDGFVDALVTGYGGLQYWRNLGDGTFEDLTSEAGLTSDTRWSSSAAWADFNQDGHLDLYVAHYVDWSRENDPPCFTHGDQREVCSPIVFNGQSDRLFESDGAGGFRDQTQARGLVSGGKGMSVLAADFDLDGDVDLYVGNDTTANFLYENSGSHWKERGLASGVGVSPLGAPEGSMGTDLGDFDLDGLPDLLVANFEHETFGLYKNLGELQFAHVSHDMGIDQLGQANVGWGVIFGDWNLDGDEDLFISNGHVVRHAHQAPIRQLPMLLDNRAGQKFLNYADRSGPYFRTAHPGRGAAAGDIDRDGDLDIVVSHVNQPVAVLENQGVTGTRTLAVELTGTRSPRSAIGTVVRLISTNTTQVRQWRGGGSFASTNDPTLVFGVPQGQTPDRVEVRWASGQMQTFTLPASAKFIHLVEGSPLIHEQPTR